MAGWQTALVYLSRSVFYWPFLLDSVGIHIKVRSSQRRAIQDSERARWLAQRYRSPHVAAGQGVYVFRPELLLTSLELQTFSNAPNLLHRKTGSRR